MAMETRHDARTAVLDQLTSAFETHAIDEQLARGRGDHAQGERHHAAGLWLLRALDGEERDPKPKGPCRCIRCAALREARR